MHLKTQIKLGVNRFLQLFNLKIETLTAAQQERRRLGGLYLQGLFDRAVFPIADPIKNADYRPILEMLPKYTERFISFRETAGNEVGYCFNNSYFTSPDTEILYAIVRQYKPKKFIEVGCGNSTKVARQAIRDGNLDTRLVSIDPSPRIDIVGFSDQIIQRPVEDADLGEISDTLEKNDILFIDSSHIAKTGSDVVFLFLSIFPVLPAGVLVHIHDIFLPYEYPAEWVVQHGYGFNEQYLLQALLSCGKGYDVIWPGHYLQKSLPDFASHFTHIEGGSAQSFWMIKR